MYSTKQFDCNKCGWSGIVTIYKTGGWCKRCRASAATKCRTDNPEKYRAKNAAWKKANPEKQRLISLRAALKGYYNISLEEYETLSKSQNNLCAIYKQPELVRARLCVDHDHATDKIRGLLCNPCNCSGTL